MLTSSSGIDWPHLAFSVGAGIGVLLIGIGFLVARSAVAGLLHRINMTLDEVDRDSSALPAQLAE